MSFKDLKYYIMTQLELYKEALWLMKKSDTDIFMRGFTVNNGSGSIWFNGLCRLISNVLLINSIAKLDLKRQFEKDSEKVLCRDLSHERFWFTDIETNAQLAKQERIQHLENLIKLYEKD